METPNNQDDMLEFEEKYPTNQSGEDFEMVIYDKASQNNNDFSSSKQFVARHSVKENREDIFALKHVDSF